MILEVNKWPPGGAGVVLSWNTWNCHQFLMNFRQFFDDFWNFMWTLWHCNSMFGRSHSATFGNSQKNPRNLSKMDFLWISTNFHEFLHVLKPKTKHFMYFITQKRKYPFKLWKKGKPTAPSVPRRSPIQVLTRLNVA